MADFQFGINFNWSEAARSTRAFIDETIAELNKIAQIRGPNQKLEQQRRLLHLEGQTATPFKGASSQPVTAGQEALQKRILGFSSRLTVDVAAIGAFNNVLRQRVAQEKQASAEAILADDATLQAVTQQALAERQLTATVKRRVEEGTEGVILESQINAELARRMTLLRRNVGVREGQLTDGGAAAAQAGRLEVLNRQFRLQRNAVAQREIAELYRSGQPFGRQLAEEELSKVGAGTRSALAAQQVAEAKAQKEATRVALAESAQQKKAERDTTAAKVREAKAAEAAAAAEERARRQTVEFQAQELANRRLVNQAIQQQAFDLLRQRAAGGDQAAATALSGTRFQQLQAGIASRQTGAPRLPGEFQTLGQFFQSKLLTTGGFAVSGALFYGLYSGIRQAAEEAVKLEKNLALVEEQMRQAGEGEQFGSLRDGILAAARDTGVLSSEMAFLALQLRGAFQDEPGQRGSIDFINEQLQSAGQLARVTGLPLTEVTDSATALAKTFKIDFETIGDTALGLQQRFGVLGKEIITFTADLAPVANEAGISFEKLAAIGAVIQRASGRSGASLAEAIGRILPSIQDNAASILAVYDQIAEGGSQSALKAQEAVTDAIVKGETGKVLERLIKDFTSFSQVQQNAVVSALGGRREAATLQALFGDTQAAIREFGREAGSDAGRLDEQFARLKDTVGQTFAELRQVLLQIGIAVANLGLLELLKDMATVGKVVAEVFGEILSQVEKLVQAVSIGDFPLLTKLLEAVAILGAVRFARGGGAGRVGAGALGLLTFGRLGRVAQPPTPTGDAAPGNIYGYPKQVATAPTANRLRGAVSTLRGALLPSVLITGGLLAVDQFSSAISGAAESSRKLRESYDKLAATKPQDLQKKVSEAADNYDNNDPLSRAGERFGNLFGGEGLSSDAEVAADALGDQASKTLIDYLLAFQDAAGKKIKIKTTAGSGIFERPGDAIKLDDINYKEVDDDLREILLQEFKRQIDTATNPGRIVRQAQKAVKEIAEGGTINLAKRGLLGQALGEDFSQFETGQTSLPQLIESVRGRRSTLLNVISRGASGEQLENTLKGLSEIEKTESQISEVFRKRAQFLIDLGDNYDGGDFTLGDLSLLLGLLNNKNFKDPEKQIDVVNQIYAGLGQVFQSRIDAAQTAAEKLAIAQEGYVVPEVVQTVALSQLVQTLLTVAGAQGATVISIAEQTGTSARELYNEIANVILYTGATVRDATLAVLRSRLEILAAQGFLLVRALLNGEKAKGEFKKQLEIINSNIAGVYDLMNKVEASADLEGTLPDFGQINASGADLANFQGQAYDEAIREAEEAQRAAEEAAREAEQAAREAREAAKALADAQIDYMRALVEGNPIEEARLDIRAAEVAAQFAQTEAESIQAEAQRIRGERALFEAVGDMYAANGDLLKALASKNPLETAKISFEQAKLAVALARGEAEKLRAQAEAVAAFKAIEDAIFDIGQSQVELLIAFAGAAGESVTVAQLQLKAMQEQLAFAIKTGAGEAEINRIRGQIVTGEAALRDAQLQKNLDTIDFNLEVENISWAQAVAQLEALLASASVLNLTEQQQRDLILRIRRLRQELTQDLQFDLPSELRLPTLYETRRLAQSGGGYQDNRQITIELNATNAIEGEAAVQTIVDALNQQPVYGATSRIY